MEGNTTLTTSSAHSTLWRRRSAGSIAEPCDELTWVFLTYLCCRIQELNSEGSCSLCEHLRSAAWLWQRALSSSLQTRVCFPAMHW